MTKTEQNNRVSRALALVRCMEKHPGKTPRMIRLADKIFGKEGWNWAALHYKASLIAGVWGY